MSDDNTKIFPRQLDQPCVQEGKQEEAHITKRGSQAAPTSRAALAPALDNASANAWPWPDATALEKASANSNHQR